MSEPESLDTDEALDRRVERHRFDRLVMLSDGVFAIAITLAALEIRVPDGLPGAAAIWAAAELPILNYVVSFTVIASFWIGNRDLFARLRRVDAPLTALVLANLCVVALVPAATHVIYAERPGGGTVRAYALVMVAAGVTNLAAWGWAARPGGPILASVPLGYRAQRLLRAAAVPAIFAAILIAPDERGAAAAALLMAGFVVVRRAIRRLIGDAPRNGSPNRDGSA